MADQTETILLEFTVDQGAAEKQLEKIEGILLDNKKAQQELTKAYKAGNITQQEYIQENIRLQQNIKKEQQQKTTLIKTINTESNSRNALRNQISALVKEYDSLNQGSTKGVLKAKELESQIAKLSNQLTKGDKAAGLFKNQIGNYPQAFGEAAKSINIAGTSVGQIGAKLASFANPATAAVGIVGALGAAYANSVSGAKDLKYAQDQLSAGVSILSNSFASLITTTGDGKGFFSALTDELLFKLSPAIGVTSNLVAGAQQKLREFELVKIDVAGIRKAFEKVAEDARRLRDDENLSNEDRIKAADKVSENLKANFQVRQSVLQREIEQLKIIASLTGNSPEIRAKIKQAQAEISDANEEINGKLTENISARKAILQLINDQAKAEAQLARHQKSNEEILGPVANRKNGSDTDPFTQAGISSIPLAVPQSSASNEIEAQQELADNLLKINKDYYDKDVQFKKNAAAIKAAQDDQTLNAAAAIAGQAAGIFEEQTIAYKVLATAQTLISTYSSATKSYDALSGIAVIGPALGAAAAGAAIASGLANVAQINGIQFAEGGYTGPGTKYQPAGIVHAGEVVWSQKDVAMAGGPAAANSMRPTSGLRPYADGGFVTNQSISSTQQALITANAFKNLPSPVVSVKEVTRVQNRIAAREQISRLGS